MSQRRSVPAASGIYSVPAFTEKTVSVQGLDHCFYEGVEPNQVLHNNELEVYPG